MRIDLQQGRVLRIVHGAGSTVTAHAGSVWVTEEASPRDVILRQGQSMILRRSGLALVDAFSDASVSFSN